MLNKCSRNGQQVLRTSDEPLKKNLIQGQIQESPRRGR